MAVATWTATTLCGRTAITAPQNTPAPSHAKSFKDAPQPSALLVGLEATFVGKGAADFVIDSIRPSYLTADGKALRGQKSGQGWFSPVEVMAKDGYAVGGLVVQEGEHLAGFRVIFMRRNGERLDPKDRYESRWIGGRGGDAEKTLACDGRPVVGIAGRAAKAVASLELIQGDVPKTAEPPRPPSRVAAAARDVFALDVSRHFFPATTSHWCNDFLSQELMRQSLLIAARDEMGLTTRDARLGDAMPTEGEGGAMEISVPAANPSTIEILRGSYPRQEVVARRQLSRLGAELEYVPLVEELEQRSRNFFGDALRTAGYRPQPIVAASKTVLPDKVATALDAMSCTAQFRAVRELHALIRAKGESMELLGALVRGYANLGILTERYVLPIHNVFKARALLYAQRAVVREKGSACSLQHRAYAMAASGLPAAALADLSAADKQAGEKSASAADKDKGNGSTLPWVKVLDAYCRYDIVALEAAGKRKELARLAGLLCFRALERAGVEEPAIEKGAVLLKLMPECCRICDGMSRMGGVGLLHQSTVAAIMTARKTLYADVAQMSGLPPEAASIAEDSAKAAEEPVSRKNLTEDFATRAKLVAALSVSAWEPAEKTAAEKVAAENSKEHKTTIVDRGEPSWAVLGRVIREQAVTQAWRRIHFESRCWGVSPEASLGAVGPLLADHPYRPLIELLSWDQTTRENATRQLASLPTTDLEGHYFTLLVPAYQASPTVVDRFLIVAEGHGSNAECGLIAMMNVTDSTGKAMKGRKLSKISPYSPYAKIILIENDWEHVAKQAAEWEKAGEQFSGILAALGERYAAVGRYQDAERCLRNAVDIMPSYQGYLRLASVYKQQQKMDEWKSTLEEYLNHPDYGLSHSQVCNQIAQYYMERGEWEKALPYAEGAAQCYSAWGLLSAAECHEGMHHWKEAESYQKAVAERYEGSRSTWYFFCRRTGHGDLKAARQVLLAEGPSSEDASSDDITMPVFHVLEKQPEKALAEFEEKFQKAGHPAVGLFAALLCDELKKNDKLATMLEQTTIRGARCDQASPANTPRHAVALARLLEADVKKGGKADLGLDGPQAKAADADKNATFFYVLGKYFSLHGKPDRAIECWKKSAAYLPRQSVSVLLSVVALRERGIDLAADKPAAKPTTDDAKAKAGRASDNRKTSETKKSDAKPKDAGSHQ
ncbi:MAG: tetratricopeptide repeat protein [Thermoguttaceae bacterium]